MSELYGLMAQFDDADQLLAAATKAYGEGYRKLDAHSPFPVEGLADAIGFRRTGVPKICFVAGAIGAVGGFFLQYTIATLDYPINVGGRPLNSWPAFIVIAFELAIMSTGVGGFLGMLIADRLPKPYHPVFNVPSFSRLASRDRFFLSIEADDPKFDLEKTRSFLLSLNPKEVAEVEK